MALPFLSGAAQWIWAPDYVDNIDPGQFVLFRKVFELQSIPSGSVLLHVSADTRYRLYLNGQSVSFGPCKSYPSRWYYETVDIAPFLTQGNNVLAAKVLRLSPSQHGCLSMARTPLAGLIVECFIEDQNLCTGKSWKSKTDDAITLITDDEWDFRLGPCFIGLYERVDGRAASLGWLEACYDDSAWPSATTKTYLRKMSPMLDFRRLYPREIPAMTETQKVFDEVVKCSGPVSLRQWAGLLQGAAVIIPANSTVTVDIGSRALTTGFLDLICESDSQRLPTVIQILCSECYESPMGDSKGRVKGDRSDHENGQLYGTADFYTLHDGMNCYSPFWFRTFRYIRLTFNAGDAPVSLQSLSYRETHYPLDVKSSITMGGPFLTKLWDISLNTLRNCMHETYEDCPFYEQQQFAMDTRSQILFTYLVSRDDRLARKAIHEFHASQRDDGLLETNFPVAGRCITIPSFSLFWVLMVYDHMVHFGDEKLTKTYVGSVDSVLNYFDQHINKLGLVSGFESDCWPFVDWIDAWFTPEKGFMGLAVPKPYYSHGAATFHSLVYAYTLSKASDLCTFLGRRDTAAEYTARQQAIVHAICTHCYDATNAVFLDGPGAADQLSQHTQIFAVLSGCAQGTAAKDLMRRTILEPGSMERVSFAMSFYAFRAVSAAGIYEECWGELIKPWGKMIENNLTTWAESESMARSDCHGWSATPLFEIATEILGVEYRSEAYTSRLGLGDEPIRVAPKPSLVDEIRGKVCTKGTSDSGSDEFVVIEWRNGEEPRVLNTVEGKRDLL